MDYYVGKDFGKILKRNALQMRRMMLKMNTDCMRVYDRNLESLPITVDLYGPYVRITDYSDGGLSNEEQWDVCDIASRMLYVEPQFVIFHERRKRQGKEQHNVIDDTSIECVVYEQGLSFKVDLTKRIDTGLFLDQAVARDGVRAIANGLDVLNLFSYTGSFSVYAAAGGAKSVTSVDLSATYSEWCEKNLAANGFSGGAYPCISQDAGEYIRKAVKERKIFDLIIFDPPSFSNSRKMEHDFDVQRDYVHYIRLLNGLLVNGGKLLFSTNLGLFRFENGRIHGYDVREITRDVAAPGFSTKKNSLRSWILDKNQDVKAPLEEEVRVSLAADEQTEDMGTDKVEASAPVKAKKPTKAKKSAKVDEPVEAVVADEPVEAVLADEPVKAKKSTKAKKSAKADEPVEVAVAQPADAETVVTEEPVDEPVVDLGAQEVEDEDDEFDLADFEDDSDDSVFEDDDEDDEEDDMLVLNWDEDDSELDGDETEELEDESDTLQNFDGKNAAARRYERRHPGEVYKKDESSEAVAQEPKKAADDRPSSDRPYNSDRPRGDRPSDRDRSRSDRPQGDRPYDRDRAPRTFDRDRPQGDRDRAPRTFDRDRPRSDRPFDRDRPPRTFDRDRPRSDRPFDRDRPQGDRPYDRDRAPRSFDRDRPQGDRPPRTFDRDRPQGDRPFDRDRAPRSFDRDRPPRRFDNERPMGDRPYDRDRPVGDRPPRRFDNDRPGSDRGPRPERTGGPKPYGFDKFKPTRTRGEDESFFWVDDDKKKDDK
jgi:23S rRNA (guanine2445-N2)-methyltransferase / 23S rRNA (guanine2069-N7)-methyltransferase